MIIISFRNKSKGFGESYSFAHAKAILNTKLFAMKGPFVMPYFEQVSPAVYQERRNQLKNAIIASNNNSSDGLIVLCASFEREHESFRQDGTFYYLTGIREPGVIMTVDLATETTTVYVPQFTKPRSQWMAGVLAPDESQEATNGVDTIAYLGSAQPGYTISLLAPREAYSHLLQDLQIQVQAGKKLYTVRPVSTATAIDQQLLINKLTIFVPALESAWIDISGVIGELRRSKSAYELESMQEAIRITMMGQLQAVRFIEHHATEMEVHGAIEGEFMRAGARAAFPSIVASGPHSTILHYHDHMRTMEDGDLVVVDVGAIFNGYCADLTRTYPVSGIFTDRQKEVYEIVLQTQEYIASIAKPGYWLSNAKVPEKSLYHLACAFLKEKGGYDQYFFHGIGHYLGLDVHDVGDYNQPLAVNDVITIEPGIYIAAEQLGIRIEDNYRVTQDGVECLSEALPKTVEELEAFVDGVHSMDYSQDEEDDDENEDQDNNCCDGDCCEEEEAIG
ncbi:MAG: aminopeptidase P N-terminal domain-containing protein [Candidatus Babeliales bacterium]